MPILDFPEPESQVEATWKFDQSQWVTVRQLGVYAGGSWQLLLQSSKTEPGNFRVYAQHTLSDDHLVLNDSFAVEAFPGSSMIISKGGVFNPVGLPQGLFEEAKALAEGYQTESVQEEKGSHLEAWQLAAQARHYGG